jgi:DNA repair protein RadB
VNDPAPTGCATIDELLGGGFERGAVTQLYGPPAAGKTNLAVAAAVEIAATGGTALLIDTEGLSADRLEQLARARATSGDVTVEDIVARIIITDALDFTEQEEAVRDTADLAR